MERKRCGVDACEAAPLRRTDADEVHLQEHVLRTGVSLEARDVAGLDGLVEEM